MEITKDNFGKVVRGLIASGVFNTQQEVVDILGSTRSYISQIVNGKVPVGAAIIRKFEEALIAKGVVLTEEMVEGHPNARAIRITQNNDLQDRIRSLQELLNAKEDLINAKNDLIDSLRERIVALEATINGGNSTSAESPKKEQAEQGSPKR